MTNLGDIEVDEQIPESALDAGLNSIPTGVIMPWAAPAEDLVDPSQKMPFLVCDSTIVHETGVNAGRVRRSTYSDLWAVLGGVGEDSPWGNGNGSTSFDVPDLTDQFIKPVGAGESLADQGPDTTGEHILSGPESGAKAHGHSFSGSVASGGSHTHGLSSGSITGDGNHRHAQKYSVALFTSGSQAAVQSIDPFWNPFFVSASGSHNHVFGGNTTSAGGHSHGHGINPTGIGDQNASLGHENKPPYVAVVWVIKT